MPTALPSFSAKTAPSPSKPASPPLAIEVTDLRKTFGDVTAVAGMSIGVERGEIFGLLGPNGAGKTTTISMLTGILPASSGTIRIHGRDVSPTRNDAKRLIGFVPQALAIYPTLTGRENLAFFGRIYGLSGEALRLRIAEVLRIVGLTERADDVVDKYSGGMKRRLNIGVSLLHQPQVLFLDEPTVGVDPQSRNAIFDAIEAMNREGMTIVYTTHYMEEAQRLCDRIAIVDVGRIVALDTPSGLCRLVGGEMLRANLNGGDAPALFAAIKAFPAVRGASLKGQTLEFEAAVMQEVLADFLNTATRHGVRISSLAIFEPSLETVFLKLTGKRLRDDT